MPISNYTTAERLEKRISADGFDLRLDDDPTAIDEVIMEASVEVFSYLGNRYANADLAASEVVQLWATDIAMYFLCTRRNNPASGAAQFRYDQAIEKLKAVEMGQLKIPLLPGIKGAAPVLSNQRVTNWPWPRIVTRNPSTGDPEGYTQIRDQQPPL